MENNIEFDLQKDKSCRDLLEKALGFKRTGTKVANLSIGHYLRANGGLDFSLQPLYMYSPTLCGRYILNFYYHVTKSKARSFHDVSVATIRKFVNWFFPIFFRSVDPAPPDMVNIVRNMFRLGESAEELMNAFAYENVYHVRNLKQMIPVFADWVLELHRKKTGVGNQDQEIERREEIVLPVQNDNQELSKFPAPEAGTPNFKYMAMYYPLPHELRLLNTGKNIEKHRRPDSSPSKIIIEPIVHFPLGEFNKETSTARRNESDLPESSNLGNIRRHRRPCSSYSKDDENESPLANPRVERDGPDAEKRCRRLSARLSRNTVKGEESTIKPKKLESRQKDRRNESDLPETSGNQEDEEMDKNGSSSTIANSKNSSECSEDNFSDCDSINLHLSLSSQENSSHETHLGNNLCSIENKEDEFNKETLTARRNESDLPESSNLGNIGNVHGIVSRTTLRFAGK